MSPCPIFRLMWFFLVKDSDTSADLHHDLARELRDKEELKTHWTDTYFLAS